MLAAVAAVAPLHGQDWPGLWGPSRTGITAGAKAPTAFQELWRKRSAAGFSEVVSVGNRAYTLELDNAVEVVVAIDAQTGREAWRARVGDTYRAQDGSQKGPIATAAIAGDDLFALGSTGQLVAIHAADGKEKWRHDLVKGFGASTPAYGFGSSPLVEGALVVIQIGGEKSGGLLALDRATGKRVWHAAHLKGTAYSSAVATTIAGRRQIIAASDRVIAVDPSDGSLLWSVAGAAADEEVNNSPIVFAGDRVLLSLWGQAVLLKITRQGGTFSATEAWRGTQIRNTQGPAIYKDGYLYGFAGAVLVCVDASTGEIRWRQRTADGSLARYGDHLLMLARSSGELAVLRASPEGYSEVTRTSVLTPGATSITGPAPAGGRVFLRNPTEIVALSIR
jgi:outer membrane protein assembly factor BamB